MKVAGRFWDIRDKLCLKQWSYRNSNLSKIILILLELLS